MTFVVEEAGERLDKFLSETDASLTRSSIQKLIEGGNITVNGKTISKSYRVNVGDVVDVEIPPPQTLEAVPENIPVEIVYEDNSLIVVNKPKGMVVHPAPGNLTGTLVGALLYACSGRLSSINGVIRPGIVHRIDKNTSGLIVCAKTNDVHVSLSEQIKAHSVTREYEALVCGKLAEKSGKIDAPIGRHHTERKKMCVTARNSKNAVTHYEVLAECPKFSHLRLRLETGRTHQIRVHMAYIGNPVFGDDVYGKPVKGLTGQCLHATKLGFIHPENGEYMEFSAPLPEYFANLLKKENNIA